MQLSQVDNRIEEIFKQYPRLKDEKKIKMLIWHYWTKYEKIGTTINFYTFNSLTTPETITRSRRKYLEGEKKSFNSILNERKYRDHYRDTGETITI